MLKNAYVFQIREYVTALSLIFDLTDFGLNNVERD